MNASDSGGNAGATISRRTALGRSLLGAAGLMACGRGDVWAGYLPTPTATPDGRSGPRAKAVIELWMAGGPTHLDTFDPKPEAGYEYCGRLAKPIETNVSGIRIGQLLPLLAKQADKYSIIRSMTHGVNAHETAAYIVQTGRTPGVGENGRVFPSLGAIVSSFKGYDRGYEGMIPPYVVLTRPQGRFAAEGFLGLAHKPFATGGDPRQKRFAVEGIVLQGVTDERQRTRRDLLHSLDTLGKAIPGNESFKKLDRAEEKAYDLILGDAGKAFDPSQETEAVRERYGVTTFGQSCLVARRLVERGVPYVTVNSGGWDTHKRHFESMNRKLPELDRGMSALLEDLAQRGLLDSTIVTWRGEFGRTPRIQWKEPWNGGRGHHGHCFSAVVAGGGFQGGQILGASDAKGEYVKDRPVYPHDLLGTMCDLLGIDPDGGLPNPRGIEVRVMPESEKSADKGRLEEIT